MTILALFEDAAALRFAPLSWTRPMSALRCGILTLGEKMARHYQQPVGALFCRPYLARVVAEQQPHISVNRALVGPLLLLNARLIASPALVAQIPLDGPPTLYHTPGGELLALRLPALSPDMVAALLGATEAPAQTAVVDLSVPPWSTLRHKPLALSLLQWPWELVHRNASEIRADAQFFPLGQIQGETADGRAHLVNPAAIFLDASARVGPGCVLDASLGPIVIEAQAEVMANAVLQGPLVVGHGSKVKIGAKLYEGTSLGPVCKVGGEVEATIFQGYSNKQHDGFLGHSLIGAWCNLGANTNCSDLKNNYSPVTVWTPLGSQNTGELFVGLTLGDHTKTGINTMFNTGTVVGVASNVVAGAMPPKFVPSFAWGDGQRFTTHRLEAATETARRVLARRNLSLSPAEADLFQTLFTLTMHERANTEID